MCTDRTVNVFWPLRGRRRKEHVTARPVIPSLSLLPSLYQAIRAWYPGGKWI